MVNNELKMEYNYNLNRYYNGCNYIEQHPDETNKYIDEVMKLLNKVNEILDKITNQEMVTEKEILGGFEIC